GKMAGASRRRLFRLSRRADQWLGVVRVSISRHRPLASAAVPTQPTGVGAMGADGGDRRRVSPKTEDPSSLAERSFRRQSPEVGAGCGNSARPDLCGGRSETGVPTANTRGFQPENRGVLRDRQMAGIDPEQTFARAWKPEFRSCCCCKIKTSGAPVETGKV